MTVYTQSLVRIQNCNGSASWLIPSDLITKVVELGNPDGSMGYSCRYPLTESQMDALDEITGLLPPEIQEHLGVATEALIIEGSIVDHAKDQVTSYGVFSQLLAGHPDVVMPGDHIPACINGPEFGSSDSVEYWVLLPDGRLLILGLEGYLEEL